MVRGRSGESNFLGHFFEQGQIAIASEKVEVIAGENITLFGDIERDSVELVWHGSHGLEGGNDTNLVFGTNPSEDDGNFEFWSHNRENCSRVGDYSVGGFGGVSCLR